MRSRSLCGDRHLHIGNGRTSTPERCSLRGTATSVISAYSLPGFLAYHVGHRFKSGKRRHLFRTWIGHPKMSQYAFQECLLACRRQRVELADLPAFSGGARILLDGRSSSRVMRDRQQMGWHESAVSRWRLPAKLFRTKILP